MRTGTMVEGHSMDNWRDLWLHSGGLSAWAEPLFRVSRSRIKVNPRGIPEKGHGKSYIIVEMQRQNWNSLISSGIQFGHQLGWKKLKSAPTAVPTSVSEISTPGTPQLLSQWGIIALTKGLKHNHSKHMWQWLTDGLCQILWR